MNVLHVTPAFYPATYWGGPIYSLYGLCNALAASQQVCIKVLTTDSAGPNLCDRIKSGAFPVRYGPYEVYFCRRIMAASVSPGMLLQLIPQVAWANVVHLTAVYSFPTIPTLMVCKALNKPVVWSPRGALQRWESSRRLILKALWESTCRSVAPKRLILHVTSEKELQESRNVFPNIDIAIIPNGIDIPEKVSHASRNGALRLLYLGRLDPIKGIDSLLSACKMLNENFDINWVLTIAGTGDLQYTKKIRGQIDALALSQQVQMVGEVVGETKQTLFENTDLVVVPSYTENFGMVVSEALAHGVPVVASRGTPWRKLEELHCGLWVENDSESLAKAIEQMSRMPLAEMGLRGQAWMKEDFSWSRAARQMIRLYEKLLFTNS